MSLYQTPILFIPGLFGCMSSEIIPRTGTWQFGFAKHMYVPFFDILKAHGLNISKDIFTLFYDWRKPTEYNVKTYLIPLIQKIEKLTGCKSIHVIAHGTGGYLARYYLSTKESTVHIKNLVLVGTPNAGFATAFSYLTGGELNIACGCILDYISLYLRMHLYKSLPPHVTFPDFFLQNLPALSEMVPSNFYNDYLFYIHNKKQHFIPYSSMVVTNTFLDTLNNSSTPYPSHTNIHLIAGEGYDTIEHFEIMPLCRSCLPNSKTWVDGKVLDCLYTAEGDGIHLAQSVFAIDGAKHLIHSDYESLLVKSASIYLPLVTS